MAFAAASQFPAAPRIRRTLGSNLRFSTTVYSNPNRLIRDLFLILGFWGGRTLKFLERVLLEPDRAPRLIFSKLSFLRPDHMIPSQFQQSIVPGWPIWSAFNGLALSSNCGC